jgi:hypothetical protein
MSYLYGTQARVYGIAGNVRADDGTSGTDTEWPTLDATRACIITGYTYTPSMQGGVQGYDQSGRLTSEAFAYAQFELAITFEFGSATVSPNVTVAKAKALIMPDLMAKIYIENMDNADLNGQYNFISGSVTGSNQGWKVGNMTLRAIDNGANTLSASKGALSAIS